MLTLKEKIKNVIKQMHLSLDIFEKTKDRRPFIALQDQIDQLVQDEIKNNLDTE